MTKTTEIDAKDLRSRTKQAVDKLSELPDAGVGDADTHRLLHELQVHNVELEMQNEELRKTVEQLMLNEEHLTRENAKLKLADEALKRSDEFSRLIIASSKDCIKVLDLDGHILSLSEGGQQLLEIKDISPYLGSSWIDFWKDCDREAAQSAIATAAKGKVGLFCGCCPTVNGTPKWWESIVSPIMGANNTIVNLLSVSRDITERKLIEDELRRSTMLLQTIIDTAPLRIFWKDRELRYLGANKAFVSDAGVEFPGDLIGKNDFQLAWRDQAEAYRNDDRSVLESGIPKISYDEMQATPDGSLIWVSTSKVPLRNEAGEVFGVLGVYEDITERMRMETENKILLLRNRAILDNLPMMAWLKDTESRLEMINKPYADACGRTIDECIGKTDLDLFPEELARAYIADDKKVCSSGQKKQVDEQIATPDGIKWHATFKAPIFDEHGLVIGTVGIAQDITDRKMAEELLAQSRDLLLNLANQVPGVIYQYRLYADGSSAFPYSSPGMNDIYEVTPEEVQEDATPVFGRLHPDDYNNVASSIQESAHTLRTFYCEFRVILPRQGLRWRWSQAQPERMPDGSTLWHGIILDITDRKRAEEAIYKSEYEFRVLAESMPQIVWITRPDGWNIYFNHHWVDYTGLTLEESYGHGWNKPFHPDDKQVAWDAWQNATTTGGDYALECRLRRADGVYRWWLIRGVPVSDEHGTVLKWFGTCTDIDDFKKTSEEKLVLAQQLQQAQKIESVGRLAGGVAHDFNNMLGVILGHTHLALMETDPDQPIQANLEEIRLAAERSADLTRQLLAFARKQTIAPKVLNLNDTVAGMLKMLRRMIGEDTNLVWQPSAGLWPVKIDPSQIDQILANLCVNARDSISGNGRIAIETENRTIYENYSRENPEAAPGDYVALTVSDNGCGMDRKTMTHIFEPFFTTKGVGEGTGLGLATVYGAVKQNGGYITVHSELGIGTTFTILIPRHAGQAGQSNGGQDEKPLLRGNETILLVEDEPAILNMVSILLTKQGYTVLKAQSPNEAVELANENASEISLLMTDVVMPDMNGRDLAKLLQAIHPNLKTLFMSGYTADVIAHHGVLDDGVHFIQKPFSLPNVVAKVREVLDRD